MNTKQIFIAGSSRSGASMMGHILNRHPHIFTFGELHFFGQLWTKKNDGVALTKKETIHLLSKLLCIKKRSIFAQGHHADFVNQANQILDDYLNLSSAEVFAVFLRNMAVKNGGQIACEQTPRNVFYLTEILQLYPNAKIINMIRDPRDVLLSQKNKWRRRFLTAGNIPIRETIRTYINYHPITISKFWSSSVQHATRVKSERLITVYFEKVLSNPENEVRKLCDFLNITYDDDMLLVPNAGSSAQHDLAKPPGIDKSKMQKWKLGGLNQGEIFLCQKVASKMMGIHGYKKQEFKFPPLSILLYILMFPFKLGLAFFLNRLIAK